MRKIFWTCTICIFMLSSCSDLFEIFNEVPESELNPIERVEVEYFFDKVDYRLENKNPSSTEIIEDMEHQAEFSSVGGSTEQIGKLFIVNYEGNAVLGKELRGTIDYSFDRRPGSESVDIDLVTSVSFSSFVNGNVWQGFELITNNILYHSSYIDDFTGLNVYEYRLSGESVCSNTTKLVFEDKNDNYTSTLITRGCSDRALIKIKVHFE